MLRRSSAFARFAGLFLGLATAILTFAPIALATSASAKIEVHFQATENVGTAPATGTVLHSYTYEQGFSSGTGATQADRVFSATYSVSSSSSQVVDVRSLTDADGTSISNVKLVGIIIENTGTTAFEVGAAASTDDLLFFLKDASDILLVPAGTRFVYFYPTGFSTGINNKDLRLANTSGSTTGTITIRILGRSA